MSRELAELVALFGRDAVLNAIANQDTVRLWKLQHLTQVIKTIQELKTRMREPSPAVEFAVSLDPPLRDALIVTLLDTRVDPTDND